MAFNTSGSKAGYPGSGRPKQPVLKVKHAKDMVKKSAPMGDEGYKAKSISTVSSISRSQGPVMMGGKR